MSANIISANNTNSTQQNTVNNGNQRAIHSQKVLAGSRKYYINTRVDQKGNIFIVVKESKNGTNPADYNHFVMIWQEDIEKISKALQQTAKFVKSLNIKKEDKISELQDSVNDTIKIN
jgi:hypothetical protein